MTKDTKNIVLRSIFYAHIFCCKDRATCPCWLPNTMLCSVLGRIKRRVASFLYNLISSTMTKAKKLDVSVKHSNTLSTASHETAHNQFQINSTLSQMLLLASSLNRFADEQFNAFPDKDYRNIMLDIEMASSNIIIKLGEAIGRDISEQCFNL